MDGPRQAVVFIHGIGEQKPLESLRRLVHGRECGGGIVGPKEASYEQPDQLSRRSYLRRYRVIWDQTAAMKELRKLRAPQPTSVSARTDFYELYWAFHFRDTVMSQVVVFLRSVLLQKRSEIVSDRLAGPKSRIAGHIPGPLLTVQFALVLLIYLAYLGRQVPEDAGPLSSIWFWVIPLAAFTCTYRIRRDKLVWYKRLFLAVAASTAATFLACWAVESNTYPTPARSTWLILICTALAVCANWLGPLTFIRSLSILGVGGAVLIEVYAEGGGFLHGSSLLRSIVSVTLLLVGPLVSVRALGGIGDAARYLSNRPDSIEEKDQIIKQTTDLLAALHEWDSTRNRYRYERIVVIGHSLGSVIGYEAITAYWTQIYAQLRMSANGSAPEVLRTRATEEVEHLISPLVDDHPFVGGTLFADSKNEPRTAEYRVCQWRLAETLMTPLPNQPLASNCGKAPARWAITDFVTIGSPLAYADVLLSSDVKALRDRQSNRAFPTCPPIAQRLGDGLEALRFALEDNGRALHHAAVFAAVRWTNIAHRLDLIGGPLVGLFGNGIQDEIVEPRNRKERAALCFGVVGSLLANTHSKYWDETKSDGDARILQRDLVAQRPRLLYKVPPTPVADDELEAVRQYFQQCEQNDYGWDVEARFDLDYREYRLPISVGTGLNPGGKEFDQIKTSLGAEEIVFTYSPNEAKRIGDARDTARAIDTAIKKLGSLGRANVPIGEPSGDGA